MILRCGWNRVDEDELVANVAVHQLAGRQLELVAAIRGVGGDRAVRRQRGVESGVGRGRDLDDDVDPLGEDAPDLVGGVWTVVVDNVVGAGRRGQLRLSLLLVVITTCPSPMGELDRGVASRTRATRTSTVCASRTPVSRGGPSSVAVRQRCAVSAGMPRLAPTSKETASGKRTAWRSGA